MRLLLTLLLLVAAAAHAQFNVTVTLPRSSFLALEGIAASVAITNRTGAEAVLGGPVEVPTPAGTLRVTLPAGSDTGRQIRLRGKGVAAQGARAAGDLLLTLRVVIGPPDAALEAFLRDWVPEQPLDPRAGLEEGR